MEERKKQSNIRKVLCVGDAHVEPGQNLSRFKWLGRCIAATKPDDVVLMGD